VSRPAEEWEIKVFALRQALIEGEESGTAEYSLNGQIKELDNEGSE
jgi:antitoxin ParD1/3/4